MLKIVMLNGWNYSTITKKYALTSHGGGVHRGADGRVVWGKSGVRGAAARWGWGQ